MSELSEILCVDDEPQVVEGLRDLLEDRFQVHTATSGPDGLEVLRRRPRIAVVMSDMRMPGMDGAAFLQEVRALFPDTVRMLLTGYSDVHAAIAAVNKGQIFRFLTKPCAPDELGAAFTAAATQYQLVGAEKVLLQQTLLGCLKALLQVLSLADPVAFGRAQRLKRFVRGVAQAMGLPAVWSIEAAALLSQLGCIDLSDVVLMKLNCGEPLAPEDEREIHASFANVCKLLASIPRLEPVREIIAALAGRGGPAGARVLCLAMEFDALEARGYSTKESIAAMATWSQRYDQKLLDAAMQTCRRRQSSGMALDMSADALVSGSFVAEDIRKLDGVLIVPRGVELTSNVIAHIGRFRSQLQKNTIRVSSRHTELSSPVAAAL